MVVLDIYICASAIWHGVRCARCSNITHNLRLIYWSTSYHASPYLHGCQRNRGWTSSLRPYVSVFSVEALVFGEEELDTAGGATRNSKSGSLMCGSSIVTLPAKAMERYTSGQGRTLTAGCSFVHGSSSVLPDSRSCSIR